MNIIDKAKFTKFLQELVFIIFSGISVLAKAIIAKISLPFFYHRPCKLFFSTLTIPLKLNYI
jgi:hypothetical protein